MKKTNFKFLFVLFCTLFSANSMAQTEFITTWQTDSTGTSGATEITIPTTGSGYNYDVDWNNDGTFDEFGLTGDVTHDFGAAGTYTIRIQGDFPRIYFDNSGDKEKLVSVDQWGTNLWTSFRDAFNGCAYMIVLATDAPDLSGLTDCRNMFSNCDSLTGDFSSWNTATVTNMGNMFSGSGYNQSLNAWDVSSVTNFGSMFKSTSFNGDVSSWVTTSAQSMDQVFRSNNFFNQDISGWDVSGVTTFSTMFFSCDAFNQDVSGWDVSSATNMGAMFRQAPSFDQDLGEWDVSGVSNFFEFISGTDMSIAHYDSLLIGWAGLTLQSGLDFDADELRYCLGSASRDSIIANFGWTFYDEGLKCYDEPLVITVQTDNIGSSSSTSFDLPIFGTNNLFDIDWNNDGTYDEFSLTGPVTHDFGTAGTYTISILGDFGGLYFNNTGDKEKILSVEEWGNTEWKNAESAFYGCSNLQVNALDTLEVYELTSMANMFRGCPSFNADISAWSMSDIKDISFMFEGCTSFNQDLNDWNTNNITTMESTFQGCVSLDQTFTDWSTDDLQILTNTFNGATLFDGDISKFDVDNLTDATGMLTGTSFSTFYDVLLNRWAQHSVQSGVVVDIGFATYCHGENSHDSLTMTYGWTLNDGGLSCAAAYEFITTWKTDNAGTSGSTSITFPIYFNASANYDVDWNNDGIYDEFGLQSSVTHDFGTAGTYTIRVKGNVPFVYFGNGGDKDKILSVDQWGTMMWTSSYQAFYGCSNLQIPATDAPNLQAIGGLYRFFTGCTNLNSNLNHWDVSELESFNGTFMYCDSLNQPFDNWDVSNAKAMPYMFLGADNFNQDVSGWDVSSVSNMESMFQEATSFNQDISGWDVSNVTTIEGMFYDADAFDQNLGTWNVENVTNAATFLALKEISTSNYDSLLIGWSQQNLQPGVTMNGGESNYCLGEAARESIITDFGWTITDDGLDCSGLELISVWTTDNPGASGTTEITIPTNSGTYSYNYDVDWDNDGIYDTLGITGDITHDYGVAGTNTVRIKGQFPQFYFNNGGDYAKIIDIQSWGDIPWLSGTNAFRGCDSLNISATDTIDLSNATAINRMFNGAKVFNSDISHWDVSTITNFSQLFGGASVYNQPLNDWDMSAATNLNSMFSGANEFNQDLDNWNVGLVQNMGSLFYQATDFDKDISNWNVSSVTNLYSTFREATSFNQNLNSWDVSSVINMGATFNGAQSFNDSIQNWDVSGVTNMETMFNGALVFNQNISGWDVGSVIDMSSMLRLAPVFNQAIGSWDVSNVTTMESLFRNSDVFNQDLSSWDVGSVTTMQNMFNGADAFDQNIGMWDVDSVTNMTGMFNTSGLSTANYDNLLIGWNAQNLQSGVSFNGGDSKYCAGEYARANMIANDLWTIQDDGPDDNTAPVPDVATLSDVIEECEITSLTAPTATDGCASIVTVTHDASLPITTQGSTTVVTWTYDDGHGNTTTQTQNLIIDDTTAPLADAATLGDITAECEVTSLTAPTATDNCSSNVTVTNDATLPITVQGTTVVTWTYDDGYGNTSTQTQNIVVQDVTPPTASNPTAISVECIGDVPVASVSEVTDEADNCLGAVTVTFESEVSDGLSCPETITRTYRVTDAAGLFIDVAQTITVQDITAPVLDAVSLSDESGYCDVTPATPTATDNCSGSIDGVADVTFPINTIGTTTITWTYTDGCGNTSTQTQDVTIEEIEVGTSIASDNITMTADNMDPGVTYQWIDCSNNLPISGETGSSFTPIMGGDYAVIITQDGCSETSACANSTVGIENLTTEIIQLYPNPSNGVLFIKSESNIQDVQVLDMMGRRVEVYLDLNQNRIDGSLIPAGKYFVQIVTEQSSLVKEIVINN